MSALLCMECISLSELKMTTASHTAYPVLSMAGVVWQVVFLPVCD